MLAVSLTLALAVAPASPEGPRAEGVAEPHRRGGWLRRLRPTGDVLELGVFGGVWLPPDRHRLVDPLLSEVYGQRYPRLAPAAPELGARASYWLESYVGLGVDGSLAITHTADLGRAYLYRASAHVVAQLPLLALAPYVVFGYGLVGQASSTLGADIDAAMNLGAGIKLFMHPRAVLTLDLRDSMLRPDTHHVTLNLGVSLMLLRGRRRPLADRDHDGIPDPGPGVRFPDRCPETPGHFELEGCPARPEAGGAPPQVVHAAAQR